MTLCSFQVRSVKPLSPKPGEDQQQHLPKQRPKGPPTQDA